jgi:hypothetical protein
MIIYFCILKSARRYIVTKLRVLQIPILRVSVYMYYHSDIIPGLMTFQYVIHV